MMNIYHTFFLKECKCTENESKKQNRHIKEKIVIHNSNKCGESDDESV